MSETGFTHRTSAKLYLSLYIINVKRLLVRYAASAFKNLREN